MMNRDFVVRLLETAGASVVQAENGQQALDYFKENGRAIWTVF